MTPVDFLASLGLTPPADLERLQAAFTHASYANEHKDCVDYERLEFIGDTIVNLHAATMLADRFPDAGPEQLTDWRQHIVQTKRLGERACELGFLSVIRTSDVEARAMVDIAGDVVEALHGAYFRSGGLLHTQALADLIIRPLVHAIDPTAPAKPATNRLQELVQRLFALAPDYTSPPPSMTGPAHDPRWHVTVSIDGVTFATASGRGIKEAKAAAAEAALIRLQSQEKPTHD